MPKISKPPTMPKTNPTKPGAKPKPAPAKPAKPATPSWGPGKKKPVE